MDQSIKEYNYQREGKVASNIQCKMELSIQFYNYCQKQQLSNIFSNFCQYLIYHQNCEQFFERYSFVIVIPHNFIIHMTEVQIQNDKKSLLQPLQISQPIPLSQQPAISQAQLPPKDKESSLQQNISYEEIHEEDTEMIKYFQQKNIKNTKVIELANTLALSKVTSMEDRISQGCILFSEEHFSVDSLLNKNTIIDKQQLKLNQYLERRDHLQSQLKKVKDVLNDNPSNQSNHIQKRNSKHDSILSFMDSEEHKRFIEKIEKLKKENQIKKKKKEQLEEIRSKQLKLAQKQEQQKRLAKEQEQKRKYLKEKLQNISKRRQNSKKQDEQSRKRYKSVSQQKRLHLLMQQQYNNTILLPSIEQKTKILLERSRLIEQVKISDLREYERQYLRQRQSRLIKRERSQSQWSYKPPPHSEKIIRILQEQKMAPHQKEENEKKKIEQRRCRQESYKQYLRDRLVLVKVDQKKKLQLQKLIMKQKPQKIALPHSSKVELGNKYLSQVSTKIKKNASKDKKESLSTNEQPMKPPISSKLKSNTSMGNYSPSLPFTAQQAKIQKIIADSTFTKEQKLQKLKRQVSKLTQLSHRKERQQKWKKKNAQQPDQVSQLLLGSVRAKVGLLQLYNQ